MIGPSQRPIFAQHTINTITFLPSAGFEHEFAAVKRHQTKAEDLTATGVGRKMINQMNSGRKETVKETRKESP